VNANAEQEKDTLAADVTAVTFVPSLKTFAMDLMEHYEAQGQ